MYHSWLLFLLPPLEANTEPCPNLLRQYAYQVRVSVDIQFQKEISTIFNFLHTQRFLNRFRALFFSGAISAFFKHQLWRPLFPKQKQSDEEFSRRITELEAELASSNEHRHKLERKRKEALRALWKAAFPEEELSDLISEQWKEMGWQGKDPSTDFRGGGFISLENLLYFTRNFQQEGDRAMWEYPFAVAGVNITFMLIQMLDLESGR
ncbi:hypothetical protein L2E82_01153 [Cichorium intybus]|uniref:Uncharacterized protein n=1 Tax=Cichorium intybus TaxID=13427 RepID=A0ACB9GY65_CICIN|nr:hypothetical protein L2E82_01153 [Cichorium intybus]